MASTEFTWIALLWIGIAQGDSLAIRVDPERTALRGSDTLAQVAVTGRSVDGKPVDLTASAKYASRDPRVAAVDHDGLIRPVGDGTTIVEVSAGGQLATIEVEVVDFANSRPVHFVGEVVPILSKHGCNAGGCHGKASGQNGFRLSLLGFDPKSDYESLVKEGRGRTGLPARARRQPPAQEADGPDPPRRGQASSPSGRPNTTRSPAGSARGCRSAPARSRSCSGSPSSPPGGSSPATAASRSGSSPTTTTGRRATSPAWPSTSRTPLDLAEVDPNGRDPGDGRRGRGRHHGPVRRPGRRRPGDDPQRRRSAVSE